MIDPSAVKAGVDIVELISADTELKKRGREFHGPCPLACQGGEDRFIVWPETQTFFCRICGSRGDAVEYIMARDRIDFRTACDLLGSPAKLPSNRVTPTPRRKSTTWGDTDQGGREAIIAEFEEELWHGRGLTDAFAEGCEPIAYLRVWRCLEDETIRRFRLGYNPHDREVNGVFVRKGIVIPLIELGEIKGLNVRRDPIAIANDPEHRKYMKALGSEPCVLNRESLAGNRTQGLAEGEFDLMVLDQELRRAQLALGVVTFGGTSWSSEIKPHRIFREANRVLLFFDGDSPGQSKIETLRQTSARYQTAWLPERMDVTEMLLRNWREDFRNWLQASLPPPTSPPDAPTTSGVNA